MPKRWVKRGAAGHAQHDKPLTPIVLVELRNGAAIRQLHVLTLNEAGEEFGEREAVMRKLVTKVGR